MNVVAISNLCPPHALGAYEAVCASTAEALRNKGWTVNILTSDFGLDPDVAYPDEPNVERLFELESTPGEHDEAAPKHRAAVARRNQDRAKEAFSRLDPDAVFVWNQAHLTLGPALAAQEMNLPTAFYLCNEHLLDYRPRSILEGKPMGQIADRAWRKFSVDRLNLGRSLVVSATLRETLASSGIPLSHAPLHSPGVDLSMFPMKEDVGRVRHPARLLYDGSFEESKRIEVILRALGLLLDRGKMKATLTVAGDDHTRRSERIQRVAEDLGVADETLMIGRVDYEDLPALYRDHDLFVFASTWDEPFAQTHLQAMASGCPIVSTDCGGPTEFLAHEENALIVPRDDPKSLAESIEHLLGNAMLRRRLSGNAREIVEEKFDAAHCLAELETFLLQSAGRRA